MTQTMRELLKNWLESVRKDTPILFVPTVGDLRTSDASRMMKLYPHDLLALLDEIDKLVDMNQQQASVIDQMQHNMEDTYASMQGL